MAKSVDLLRLPVELVGVIVRMVSEGTCRKDLLNLGRVNRLMQQLIKVELYRRLEITKPTSYGLITRSFIENPALRSYVRQVTLSITGRSRDYSCDFFRYWQDSRYDQTKLSPVDTQLLLLFRSMCTHKGRDNARLVLVLFMLLLHRAEYVSLQLGSFWNVPSRAMVAGLQTRATFSSIPITPAGTTTTAGVLSPNSQPLFPALKKLLLLGESTALWGDGFVFGAHFSFLCPLLCPATLVELHAVDDRNIWNTLESVDFEECLSLETIRLASTKADSSSLCKLLRRCPKLRRLAVSYKASWQANQSDWDSYESINAVLPAFCPLLEELSIYAMGRGRSFLKPPVQALTCLPQMTSLKKLNVDVECFYRSLTAFEQSASSFPHTLPPRLEDLFLDTTTWVWSHPNGGLTAGHADVAVYRKGVESLISAICTATKEDRLPLRNIVIGCKWGKYVPWSRNAYKQLSGTNAKFVITNSPNTTKRWTASWGDITSL